MRPSGSRTVISLVPKCVSWKGVTTSTAGSARNPSASGTLSALGCLAPVASLQEHGFDALGRHVQSPLQLVASSLGLDVGEVGTQCIGDQRRERQLRLDGPMLDLLYQLDRQINVELLNVLVTHA